MQNTKLNPGSLGLAAALATFILALIASLLFWLTGMSMMGGFQAGMMGPGGGYGMDGFFLFPMLMGSVTSAIGAGIFFWLLGVLYNRFS
ncbi:MAG TPA: hypothetical protein ENJ52_09635 [Aliiroseovarius sp.]|nr:hypothetical protein [Aliiroseovarius sp.]